MTTSETDLLISSKPQRETSILLNKFLRSSANDQRTLFHFWLIIGIVIAAAHGALAFSSDQAIKLFPFLTILSVAFSLKYGIKALYGGIVATVILVLFNVYFEGFSLWTLFFFASTLLSYFTLHNCFNETLTFYNESILFSEKCREEEQRLHEHIEGIERERLSEREAILVELEKIKQEAELRKVERNTFERLLENAKSEILNFNVQKNCILHEVISLRTATTALQEENDRLSKVLQETHTSDRIAQEKEYQALQLQLNNLNEEKERLRSLLESQEENLSHYKLLLEKLEHEKLQLESSQIEIEQQKQLALGEIQHLHDLLQNKVDRSDYENLKASYDDTLETLAHLESKLSHLTEQKMKSEEELMILHTEYQALANSLKEKIDLSDFIQMKQEKERCSLIAEQLQVQIEKMTNEVQQFKEQLYQQSLKEKDLIEQHKQIEVQKEKLSLELNGTLKEKDETLLNYEILLKNLKDELAAKDSVFKSREGELLNHMKQDLASYVSLKEEAETRLQEVVSQKDELIKQLQERSLLSEELEKQKKMLSALLNQLKAQFEEKNKALSEARQERYQLETKYLLMLQDKMLEEHSQNPLWDVIDSLEARYNSEKEALLEEIQYLEETITSLIEN